MEEIKKLRRKSEKPRILMSRVLRMGGLIDGSLLRNWEDIGLKSGSVAKVF